jgi:hypothetical protein
MSSAAPCVALSGCLVSKDGREPTLRRAQPHNIGSVQNFIKAFIRDGNGAWWCVKQADLELPTGRIQGVPGSVFVRGTRFMGLDLAELLDEQEKDRPR